MGVNAELLAKAKSGRTATIELADFSGTDLNLGKTNLKAKFNDADIPERLPDGRWVHLDSYTIEVDADIDSDGTPSAALEAERVLGHLRNFRLSMLSGGAELLPGGNDIDLRTLSFLQTIRHQRLFPSLPADAGASSAADIFSDKFQVEIAFAGHTDREGRSMRDMKIPIAFFTSPDGEDALRFDIAGATELIGSVNGVTFNSPLDRLAVYANLSFHRFPIMDAMPYLRYAPTSDLSDDVLPIKEDTRAHITEYAGFRQFEEDTEGLTFVNAGTLGLRFGSHQVHKALAMADFQTFGGVEANSRSRPQLDSSYLPVSGHLPLAWSKGIADRTEWPATPVHYELSSLGSSRTEVRLLRSELHTWTDDQIRRAAKALGVAPDRLRARAENIRTSDIDPELLPRRIDVS